MDPFFEFFRTYRITPSQGLYPSVGETHKEYVRKPAVELPEPVDELGKLNEALLQRQSTREFDLQNPVSLQKLSTVLRWSFGPNGKKDPYHRVESRTYPSGGAKFPVEPYVFVAGKLESVSPGMYHYNPSRHRLEQLMEVSQDQADTFRQGYRYSFALDVPVFLLLTFVKSRPFEKYGEFAYKIGLIEAGHVAQNVYLVAAQQDMACVALGGGDFELTHELAGIDGVTETHFYTVALGEKRS